MSHVYHSYIEHILLKEIYKISPWKTACLISYGFLLGSAGVSILSSKDAKNVYTHVTAAVKHGGDSVKKTLTTLKENCEDINADANDINQKRAI
ncbi:DUF6110 family protein [Absicoccus porci]|uniref:DUF6110 family protein n=1 Tax=Absicoccus porci TaxID=2486576 RepID=UPI0030C76DAA